MKLRMIALYACLLMPVLATSQTNYPKKIVLGSDTVIALTDFQMRVINGSFVKLDYLDSLCKLHVFLIGKQDSIISLKTTQISQLRIDANNLADSTIKYKDKYLIADTKKHKRNIELLAAGVLISILTALLFR